MARKLISFKKINTIFKKDEPILDEIEGFVSKYGLEISPGKIDAKKIYRKLEESLGFLTK